MEKLLNVDEVSWLTGISKSKLYKLTAQKKIPHIKIGRRVVFCTTDLEKWFDIHRSPSGTKSVEEHLFSESEKE